MPCNDVTEIIQLTLDADDRLTSYALNKKTCGRGIGAAAMMLEAFAGKTADELLAWEAEDYCHAFPTDDPLLEFLQLKHLFAVQAAIGVLTGSHSGGPASSCPVAEIRYDGGEILIEAHIPVDLLTEKIRACGRCKGCGANARTARAAQPVTSSPH